MSAPGGRRPLWSWQQGDSWQCAVCSDSRQYAGFSFFKILSGNHLQMQSILIIGYLCWRWALWSRFIFPSFLKRSSRSKFMPNAFVFPGGVIAKDDFNPSWLKILPEPLKPPPNAPRPLLMQPAEEGEGLPRHVAFRWTEVVHMNYKIKSWGALSG